jgi:hypothetical protein
MSPTVPDKYEDPEGYKEVQYLRMRAAREEHEAYDAAWNAAWEAECSKPIAERQWFRSGDLCNELARDPQTLEENPALRGRISEKLTTLIQYRQFADGQVATLTLSGEVPSFEPLGPRSPGSILVLGDDLMLRRDFVERFIIAYEALPNALPLRRQWLGEFNQEAAASSSGARTADAAEHATTLKRSAEREQQQRDEETGGAHGTSVINSVEVAIDGAEVVTRHAEWIFNTRHQVRGFEKLYDLACKDSGSFKKKDFRAAYQEVYETEPHRPPATGWPLRSPYKERDEAEKSLKYSRKSF